MRPIVFAIAFLLPAGAAQAQGVADLLRSVTGALRGTSAPPPQQQQAVTPVVGVRGMDEADAAANAPASPSSDDYVLIEGWAATRAEAEHAAKAKGLAGRPATLKADGAAPKEGTP